MENPADFLYKAHRESSEKFDYFVCGVSGALFAYLGQKFDGTTPVLAFILEVAALGALATSFYYGLKRVEISVTCPRGNYRQAEAAAAKKSIFGTLNEGKIVTRGRAGKDSVQFVERAEGVPGL
jgi:hypothetical protein